MNNFNPSNYSPASDLLTDRVILISGAGAGIGRAVARAFAAHGASVVLTSRTLKNLQTLQDEIVADGYPRPVIVPMDLAGAGKSAFRQLAERINDASGRLNGIVHNAGVLGSRLPIEHYDATTWDEVMHLNLTVPFIMTQALMRLLRSADDASVIFTSSGVGRKGRAGWGAYAVSKFGTEGLSQVLADELASTSIRVNCINPGRTRTAMRAAAYPQEDPNTLLPPQAIVGAYLYLMGPDSRNINGQSLNAQ
ncbi:MAG TPA: YciK family oxidoreductase [Gammaproteobacteria bacterium]|jgi:NAD(P)-dependent dehydrogenase (short-subunit alcohol dehydrogenase family)|nr:YciK family oxidoreductase [Chromatiales bacterium]MCP4925396.1 YciK family oxidoreductase [Gammaproteobacteria bacterium]MDP7297292.1 YciK family oxidoreductase [Gammaproteobacteria bacterium]MDP7661256.1 YciK family oxidoreductase [Gammaproteobacteria bacterium]HJP39975.1 YciK family oxidoreductase [Gammaproteobacteria bacterium]